MLTTSNNKRIAKNTLYLYIRMFVSMVVGLYTSRVVLNTLGVSDYGIFNVMGGVIGMLAYVNSLFAGGTSRFLTIDLGKKDINSLKETFSVSLSLAFFAVFLVLLLGETIGHWFMSTQLNIENSRMEAAQWVYQCALFSCCLSALESPFTASIIAHEKMGVYAYMSIFDVTMKLFIVFMLLWFDVDKLKLYALLMFFANLLTFVLYAVISYHLFEECKFRFSLNRTKLKSMMTYSGWNMVGAFANILNNYGLNILLNIFFGTIVNAARGIALQISNIVQNFYGSIQTASQPQIVKYYAEGNINEMSNLINNTSKYCTCLLLCITIPICFNIDTFLLIWLGQNPEYTSWFTRVILLQIIYQSLDRPIGMGIHAVGKMMLPNVTAAVLYLSVFPITYLAFKYGASPVMGYCVYLCITPFILCIDLLILRTYCGFSISKYILRVLAPVTLIGIVASILSYLFCTYIRNDSILQFIGSCIVSFLFTSIPVYLFGIPKNIRKSIWEKAINVVKR